MKTGCCKKGSSRVSRGLLVCGHSISWGALLLMPKCPICLAAHLTFWTGIGVTASQAGLVRIAVLGICTVAMVYLSSKSVRKILAWRKG